jgi:hypothetical protein
MYGTKQSTVKKVDLSKVTYINGNTNKAFQDAYDYVEEVIYNNNLVITNLTTTSTNLVEQLKELGFTRKNIDFTGIN